MYKAALLLLIMVPFVACSNAPAPSSAASQPAAAPASTPAATPQPLPAVTTGGVQPKLQELAGKGATNCGDVKALSGDELNKSSNCAMDSAKSKKPFVVSYDMPGLSVGVAGNAEGKLFMAQASEGNGKLADVKSQPCPAELRIAQSGRVTCMPAGSMGVPAGADNPHGGAQGASPHGGSMGTPPAGTPNPHATAPTKSH